MRNLDIVIDQVLDKVPSSKSSLIAGLNSVKSSIPYTPPEAITGLWRKAQRVLDIELGPMPFSAQWKNDVADIWMGLA